MKTQRSFFCDSCGKTIDLYLGETVSGPYENWITVTAWEGMGAVGHHSFCSLECLKEWLESPVPRVPDVFLRAFGVDNT
jgi:hypothetical protein